MDADNGYSGQFSNIFATAQCTPDLTPARCRSCLADIIAGSIGFFASLSAIGGRTLAIRCTFRYETAPFISGPLMVSLGGTPAPAPAPRVNVTPAAARGIYSLCSSAEINQLF